MKLSYIPQSEEDQAQMLAALGLKALDELFEQIPPDIRSSATLDLPSPLPEPALMRHLQSLARRNRSLEEVVCFAGGGIYDRFIPAIVRDVIQRPEFVTPYTPYQAEVSQGTLQVMFEYQTMVCELMEMEAANASLYDGATALAEAVLMSATITRRSRALLSRALSPAARMVTHTYCSAAGVSIEEIPFCLETGRTDTPALQDLLGDDVCCVALQQPNFFGVVEEMAAAAGAAHATGALFIASVDPVSLGVLAPPGRYDADMAVGEGQALGLPVSFGGPLLGLFACKQKHLRKMPGRVAGRTRDAEGNTAYCLTLQTREQHIRRDRATSNICTSQQLCALAAAVYLAALGPEGLRDAAQLGADGAHYLHGQLTAAGAAIKPRFSGPFLNEFVLQAGGPAGDLVEQLCDGGHLVGPSLDRDYPELEGCLLLASTEQRTRAEMDDLVRQLAGA